MDEVLYTIKGLLAVAGLVLYVVHLVRTKLVDGLAQRLRYVALLMCSSGIAFSSVKQFRHHDEWSTTNTYWLLSVTLILLAAIASLRSDRRTTLSSKHSLERTHQ